MLGKRLINSNSAAAGGSCTTDTLQILGDTSCVAYYKMSDATDESGSYDGTPTNVNFNVAGKFGNAGSFNGSSSKISLNNTAFQLTTYSISLWVNSSDYSTANTTIYDGGLDNTGGSLWGGIGLGFNANKIYYYGGDVAGAGGSGFYTQTGTTTITNSTWYNVTLIVNGTSITGYINGTQDTGLSRTLGANIVYRGTPGFNLGVRSGSFGAYGYLNGKIDQVRIFNKALSSTEVTTLYNEVYCVPTIVPTDYFNPVIYTGNGSTRAITGTGFEPDLVWIKGRSDAADYHNLFDSVRGADRVLISNLTNAEYNGGGSAYLPSFDSDGFSLSGNAIVNGSGQTYVAWNWKAGGAPTATNSAGAGNVPTAGSVKIDGADSTTALAGTIAATSISANTDSGFSVVKYTGNGNTSQQSYGHGLSSAPELVFNKGIDTLTLGTNFWVVGGTILGNGGYMFLNVTNGKNTASSYNGNQVPDSNVVYISGTSDLISNENNKNFISYCFHSVDGYSKIGSYVGTGATGNSIVTGFRPAFVMVKTTNTNSSWFILDNKRNVNNPRNSYLMPDSSSATVNAGSGINFLANGFEFTGVAFNDSGNSWIFMAFAEEVFNPNGVTRNATNPFGDASELALYKFEDNANDAEGSYNGTASNVTYATGYIDKAAVFNGSSSYITYSSFLSTTTDNSSASFSIWVKFNSFSSSQVISGGASGQSPPFNIYVYHSAGTSTFAFERGFGGLIHYSSTYNSAIQALTSVNTWYHIAYNYTKSTKAIEVFLNGQSIGTDTLNASASGTITSTQLLGGNSGGGSFNGSLDQVRIFNRTLDSGEVTQLYNE